VFHVMESKRLDHIKQCLQIFCDLEHELILKKQQLLHKLESSMTTINSDYDLNLFINQNKACETHHKYSKALALLDVDYETRRSDINEDQDHYSPIINDFTYSNKCGNLENLHSTDLEVPHSNSADIICNSMNEHINPYPHDDSITDNYYKIGFQDMDQCDLRTILSATSQMFQGKRYSLFYTSILEPSRSSFINND
jgi:hypothetical protein